MPELEWSKDETQDGMTPEEGEIWRAGFDEGVQQGRGPGGRNQMKVMLLTLLMSSLKTWIREDPDRAIAEIDKMLARLDQ